jgi:MFS transporter, DHA1 family, inner membrane transport protein
MSDHASHRSLLWAFVYGNFLIGTGVLLPAGILNQLAEHFSITASQTGFLMLISGIVVGVGAPLIAAITSHVDRRLLLTFALVLYGVGHALSAVVDNFNALLIIRALMITGAAIFTPQAAATLGVLLPREKRPGAIAFIFIGWSVATVIGVPLGNLLADKFGWQMVFALMALACVPGIIAVWRCLGPGIHTPHLTLASWRAALTNPLILLVLSVTLLSFIGQFVIFSYMAPLLAKGFGASAFVISGAFAIGGAAGVIGNMVAARVVHRFGVDYVIAVGLAFIAIGLLLFGIGFGSLVFAFVALTFHGAGNFVSNSLQQSRLAQIAPPLAAATIALNTSAVYLGQAVGTGIGGTIIDRSVSATSAFVGLGFSCLALLASLAIQRLWLRK